MSESEQTRRAVIGWTGFLVGAAALLLAVTLFWAGPFAPQQATGVTLGELAADVGQSALRKIAGQEQPAPQPVPRDLDDFLRIGVALLGGLAVVFGAAAMARQERTRPAIGAAALGGGAILFQLFTWYALALIGVLLIWAVLQSLGDVFGDMFGG
ncbi:MAG: hypothetical protein WCD16_09870 [Paracoccaceae bacterium]